MTDRNDGAAVRIPLQVSRGSVVASIQVDLTEAVLQRFRTDLLGLLHETGVTAVILDVSGISVLDAEDFEALRSTMAMAELMGARCVLSGLQPGVVASIVELIQDLDDVVAALDLDEAFTLLESGATDDSPDPHRTGDSSGEAVMADVADSHPDPI